MILLDAANCGALSNVPRVDVRTRRGITQLSFALAEAAPYQEGERCYRLLSFYWGSAAPMEVSLSLGPSQQAESVNLPLARD